MSYESEFLWVAYFLILGLAFTFLIFLTSMAPVYILAKKTHTPKPWLALIPIANLYLTCKIGQKPGWWMLLMLVPFVQILFFIFTWMGICSVRNRPSWLGILIIVPIINFVLPWYLALSDEKH